MNYFLSCCAVPFGRISDIEFDINELIMSDSDLPRSLHHLVCPLHPELLTALINSRSESVEGQRHPHPHDTAAMSAPPRQTVTPHDHVTHPCGHCSTSPTSARRGLTSSADRCCSSSSYSKPSKSRVGQQQQLVESPPPSSRGTATPSSAVDDSSLEENVRRIMEVREMPYSFNVFQRRRSFNLSWEAPPASQDMGKSSRASSLPPAGKSGPPPDLVSVDGGRWASVGRELRHIADDFEGKNKKEKTTKLIQVSSSAAASTLNLSSAAAFCFTLSFIGYVSWRVFNGFR